MTARQSVPGVPQHVAIIMDGNGRWAQARFLPRAAGHRAGVSALRVTINECLTKGCGIVSVFAFSSENWRRPPSEVGLLMQLLLEVLEREIDALSDKGVRVRFIGDRDSLALPLRERMGAAEARTSANSQLTLVIALAYGGRWDLVQAARVLARQCLGGVLSPDAIDEQSLGAALALAQLPDPDLFIRTGGERRISNFLLWNLAYTELWFTDVLWPDFGARELAEAFAYFAGRNRRFGQLTDTPGGSTC